MSAFAKAGGGGGWKTGWRNSKRRPVDNRALWEELLELTAVHEVDWVKVKGHGDDELNDRCDRLAVAARERLKAELAAREVSAAVAVVTPGGLDQAEKLS